MAPRQIHKREDGVDLSRLSGVNIMANLLTISFVKDKIFKSVT